MTDIDDGGSAFPSMERRPYQEYTGMSLRDYFAAKAMAAIISKMDLAGVYPPRHTGATGVSEEDRDNIMSAVSVGSYRYADAMLKERDK